MRTRRRGFSQVDLLIVLLILSVLVGVMFAAIQRAKGSAQRIHSTNNLRNLAIAMFNYENAAGKLPPGRDANGFSAFAYFVDELELLNAAQGLDLEKPLADKANTAARKFQAKLFLSPRDSLPPTGEYGVTNYFLCAGPNPGLKDNTGVFCQDKQWTIADISNNNGTSMTVMMGESLRGDPRAKPPTVQRQHVALKKDALKDLKDESGVADFKAGKELAGNRGACWLDGNFLQATFTGTRVPNDPRPDIDCEGAGGLSALRSLDGLTPLLFVDGHVSTVTKKMDIKVWKAITDVKNKNAVTLPE